MDHCALRNKTVLLQSSSLHSTIMLTVNYFEIFCNGVEIFEDVMNCLNGL